MSPQQKIIAPPLPGSLAHIRATLLAQKASSIASMQPSLDPRMVNTLLPPADGRPLIVMTVAPGAPGNPGVNYPAPGAAAAEVIPAYTVPEGYAAAFNLLAIIHIGGGQYDYSGNVIWRVKINDAAVQGLDTIVAHIGTSDQPVPIYQINLIENDTLHITAEVPAAFPAMPAGSSTAARIHGWQYPLQRALGGQK